MKADYFIRKADLKVLSTPVIVRNGAITSIDSLEEDEMQQRAYLSWNVVKGETEFLKEIEKMFFAGAIIS